MKKYDITESDQNLIKIALKCLNDNFDDIKYISDSNSISDITRKISLISKIKAEIKYNLLYKLSLSL